MAFHEVHCPRCGRKMFADELAFDFGGIINTALEKAKNRTFGATEEWYDLTNLNLCLYLSLDDLKTEYNFKQTGEGASWQGQFVFTTKHLADQFVKLADSMNPNMSIGILASSVEMEEYEKLTKAMALSAGVDIRELAERIQEIANRIQRNPNVEIASFHVTVYMQKDDRNQHFANRLLVKFGDGDYKNITKFVCKGEKGRPCGKVLYGHAGQYKEIIIGLAGTARVGKTAYLASLLASILRKGNGIERLGHDQNVITNIAYADESFEKFKQDLLDPYANCEKIKKTETIFDKVGDSEAISLFSLTFSVKNCQGGNKYIFTFIDMPGEVYDDHSGGNDVMNKRRIITYASMIWLCIAPAQIAGEALVAGGDMVNTNLGKAFANLSRTMESINCLQQIPTAVLITCSDLIKEEYGLFNCSFNPFEGVQNPMRYLEEKTKASPWISRDGRLYYSNMHWFVENAYAYLDSEHNGLPESVKNIFGEFTPFAIASYGKAIDNPYEVVGENNIPTPSMIEAPFLWTLGVLGMLPVYKEEEIIYTKEVRKPFKLRPIIVEEIVVENRLVEEKDIKEKLFYY